MSERSYDDFLTKKGYEYICENELIEWNKNLHILVHPGENNTTAAKIIFTKKSYWSIVYDVVKKIYAVRE